MTWEEAFRYARKNALAMHQKAYVYAYRHRNRTYYTWGWVHPVITYADLIRYEQEATA